VGVPREDAEQDAEGIEHYVSDAALAAFERFLGKRRDAEIAVRAGPGRDEQTVRSPR